jgi:hypothetical protein
MQPTFEEDLGQRVKTLNRQLELAQAYRDFALVLRGHPTSKLLTDADTEQLSAIRISLAHIVETEIDEIGLAPPTYSRRLPRGHSPASRVV